MAAMLTINPLAIPNLLVDVWKNSRARALSLLAYQVYGDVVAEVTPGRRSGGVAPAVAVMTGMTGMTVVVRMAPGACGVVGRHRHGIGVPRPVRNGMGQRLPLRQQQGQQGHADDAARGVGAAERLHAVARSRSGSTADRVGWHGVASCHRPPSMPQTTTSGRW